MRLVLSICSTIDNLRKNGLLREIAEMRQIALEIYGSENAVDHTEGIFQSIGYKEFGDLKLPQDDPSSDPSFPAMVDLTKARTLSYARHQLRWIRKQLLPAVREARYLGGEVDVFAVPGGRAGERPAIDVLNGEPSIICGRASIHLSILIRSGSTRLADIGT